MSSRIATVRNAKLHLSAHLSDDSQFHCLPKRPRLIRQQLCNKFVPSGKSRFGNFSYQASSGSPSIKPEYAWISESILQHRPLHAHAHKRAIGLQSIPPISGISDVICRYLRGPFEN